MQRRGLIGPLIIVGLGVLFLMRNFRDIPIWEYFAKYWPVLLIIWGAVRLIEAAFPPEPGAPRRSVITGGEIVLIVFLCLIGSGIFWGRRIGTGINIDGGDVIWPWGEKYHYTQEAKLAVPEKQPSITIINPRGEIRVTGDATAEIQVKAEKQVQAASETHAKEMDQAARVEVVKEGTGYVVRSNADHAGGRGSMEISLEIHVPKGATLDVQSKRGDVVIADVAGAVTVNVERGDLSLRDLGDRVKVDLRRGSFTAERVKGSIEMDGRGSDIQVSDVDGDVVIRGEYSGNINFANVKKVVHITTSRTDLEIQKLPGKVDMTIGSLTVTEPSGPVTVDTRQKDIRIEEFDGPVKITNRDASVELTTKKTPVPSIQVENASGRIDVTLPANGHFQVEATARRGEVNSEFSEISSSHENDQGSMRGGVGKNGPTVKLNTTYGAINLRKS